MASQDDPTGRDLRIMWQTATVIVFAVAAVLGSLVYAITWAVRIDARIEALEKWTAAREKEAARELWRRDRERSTEGKIR